MNFVDLVDQVLNECNMAGGINSVFGTNVTTTATPFSGDTWNTKDQRIAKSLYGGVMTRRGLKKKKKDVKKR